LPYLFLRLGLAVTFIWIGVDIFRNPNTWIGYVPVDPGFSLSREAALSVGGVFDVTLGLMLLFRVWSKLAGWLAVLHLVAILIVQGINAVLIRDVGLLGTALALALWPTRYHRRKWKLSPFGKKSDGGDG